MLWDENRRSVAHRYGDTTDGDLPGPTDEMFLYWHQDAPPDFTPNIAQVFMSIDCYEYQTCEHPGWETSSAYAFIQALRSALWHRLPNYEDAKWGAPEIPTSNVRRIA
jgi:hypothetical protein